MPIADWLLGALAHAGANQQIIKPPNPAAGANYLLTPPGQYVYRVRSVRFSLTNNATVAGPNAAIQLQDVDGSLVWQDSVGTTLGAGVTTSIQWLDGVDTNTSASVYPLPDFLLYPGSVLNIGSVNPQATEQVSGIVIVVHRIPIADGGRIMVGLTPGEE